jgi:hypothetical protein
VGAERGSRVSQAHVRLPARPAERARHDAVVLLLTQAALVPSLPASLSPGAQDSDLRLGRPETDQVRCLAMNLLGLGLTDTNDHEAALSVREAELSTMMRLGAPEEQILTVKGNLAMSYGKLGRFDESLSLRQDVYSGDLKRYGEEHVETLVGANNYAWGLCHLARFEEAKALTRKVIPTARRVLGENNETALRLRWAHGEALYNADGATLNDLREAVTTLEDTGRIARRVLGSAYPLTKMIEGGLQDARDALRAREATSK